MSSKLAIHQDANAKLSASKHIHVRRVSAKAYAIDLNPAFNNGAVPNGGYVASHFLAAALAHVSESYGSHANAISAHWDFLARSRSGPGILLVDELKTAPTMSVLRLSLYQHDETAKAMATAAGPPTVTPGARPLVVAAITCKNMRNETGPSLDTGWELTHPSPSQSPPLVDAAAHDDPIWQPISPKKAMRATKHFDVYEQKPGVARPSVSLDLWFRHGSGDRITNLDLPYLMDLTPAIRVNSLRGGDDADAVVNASTATATKSTQPSSSSSSSSSSAWYPTLNMHLDFKRSLPESGEPWLRLRTTAKVIRNGRFDCDVEVFDVSGSLVAQARHTAMIMDMSRNTANRSRAKPANKM